MEMVLEWSGDGKMDKDDNLVGRTTKWKETM